MTQQEPPADQPPSPPAQEPIQPPPPQHTQMKIANVLVIAFFIYAGYHYFTDPKPDDTATPSSKMVVEEGDAASPAKAVKKLPPHPDDPRMDRLHAQEQYNNITGIFPKIRTGVAVKTLVAGEGRAAFCGQTAQYRLQEPGKASFKTVTGKLGAPASRIEQSVIWGIEGARIGEKREIRVADRAVVSLLSAEAPQDISVYTVEILGLSPDMPKAGELPLRRFLVKGDAGYDFRCGDEALYHLTLHDASGKLLFTSLGGDPLFTSIGIGKGIPLGIEMALREMGPGGEYTLIIPPELSLPLYGKDPAPKAPEGLKTQPYPVELLKPQSQVLIADIQIPRTLYPEDKASQ